MSGLRRWGRIYDGGAKLSGRKLLRWPARSQAVLRQRSAFRSLLQRCTRGARKGREISELDVLNHDYLEFTVRMRNPGIERLQEASFILE